MNRFVKQVKTVAFYVFSIIFWGGLSLVVINYVSPGTMSKITAIYDDNISSWDDSACEANKIRCLEAKQRQLEEIHTGFNKGIKDIHVQIDSQNAIIEKHELLVVANSKLVSEGAELISSLPEDSNDIDVWFSGQNFTSLTILNSQLDLLRSERSALEAQTNQAKGLRKDLAKMRESLILQRGKLNLELKMIPSKLALLESSQYLEDFDDSMLRIDGLITDGTRELNEVTDMILSTEEFIKKNSK
ncbi:hypothetical protein LRP52_46560 [Photobacterium sp. ZSDE20]|uniref:Chromosome partitioning protein ParA n=1 Tax=Photobacterium pectinilyticum TaxID=2906793 RepID=A0ABT1N8Y8_9GAMM|nr:hypothetical protein [Photobacterium sp. ZSDE20]MCQ1061219.1 hypothetical protein [Photobacterium sp. ZSDE20]MDD1829618.1 hypothetical protein [Photobacterium sp. ZSDE20]